MVHGDTATTLAVSLAAYFDKIKIGHVEAGLRTGDLYSPWPEEGNRKLTGALANFHFAPTRESRNNLLLEGISQDKIFVVGNSVIDALLIVDKKIEADQYFQKSIREKFKEIDFSKKIILVTGHRRENFGDGLKRICSALKTIASNHPDTQIVYPVHLNPNVKIPVNQILR